MTRGWFEGAQGRTQIEPGDGSWLVFCAYRSTRSWSADRGRRLARWWMLKEWALADWRKYEAARDIDAGGNDGGLGHGGAR